MSINETGRRTVPPLRNSSANERAFIALPVLNEAENIVPLAESIRRSMSGLNYLLYVIDDGSTDGTLDLLRVLSEDEDNNLEYICRRKEGRGSKRGLALLDSLRRGAGDASFDVFVEMDGDGSHRPEELRDNIELIRSGEADVAIACKYREGSLVTNRPRGRRLLSRSSNFAVRVLLDGAIHDYTNGYRFFNRRAADLAVSTKLRYGSPIYLTEVLALWRRNKLVVAEVPTTYVGRNEGLSKLRWIDLVKAGIAVFEVGTRYHVRGFKPLGVGHEKLAQIGWRASDATGHRPDEDQVVLLTLDSDRIESLGSTLA